MKAGEAPAMSYDQIAEALGLSKQRVVQLEKTGLARLRKCFELIERGVPIERVIERCRASARYRSGVRA